MPGIDEGALKRSALSLLPWDVEMPAGGGVDAAATQRERAGSRRQIFRFSPPLYQASVRGIQSRKASTSRFQKRHSWP